MDKIPISEPANDDTSSSKRAQLQNECRATAAYLKQLHDQERRLALENQILAREALSCGFDPTVLEPPPPKGPKRKYQTKKMKEAAAAAKESKQGS